MCLCFITKINDMYSRYIDIMISALVITRDSKQVRGLDIDGDRDKSPLNGKTMIENGGRTGGKDR